MQTPAGHEIVDGVYHVKSWVERDLQPVVPVPLHAHAAGLGADLRVPAGRACRRWQLLRGVGAALGAARAARRADAGGAADPGADLRRRHARPEHAANTSRPRSPRWKASGRPSAARRCCCSPFPTPTTRKQPLRDRDAEAGQPDPHARARRRDQGPERLPRRAPAAAAAVLRLPHHGRHGHADAGDELARLVAVPARAVASRAACRARCCGSSPA